MKTPITRIAAFYTTLLCVSSTLIAGISLAESLTDEESSLLSFTKPQAEAGKASYARHCASCHGIGLQGIGVIPALQDDAFNIKWGGKNANLLGAAIWRMPSSVDSQSNGNEQRDNADIMALILYANGVEPSDIPLPNDLNQLAGLMIPKGRNHASSVVHEPDAAIAKKESLLHSLPHLSAAKKLDPDDADWLQWGRTYDGHSHSPLTQINSRNVADLTMAWKLPLHPASSHAAPLVHQGVMYLHVFPDSVLAIDAAEGSILWKYRHIPDAPSSGKMGISVQGNKVFVPTSDMKLLAIDSQSGKLIWETEIPPNVEETQPDDGFFLRSAPMVVGGKVIQGVSAPRAKFGAFIAALDIDTGREVWRFNTIARPGEPGDSSWNGIPIDERSGGSVWQFGTYDAELNLVYYGVSQTYDTAPLLEPVLDEEFGNDALYTNSTVALNPDSGDLVWFYQHMPNGQWDLDWAFERQIVRISHQGVTRKAAITIGKMGILDALDAATGDYLFSVDMGTQNYVTAIDAETGDKTIDPEKLPHPGINTLGCPHLAGVRNWPPTSFNPTIGMLFVPVLENCARLFVGEGSNLTSGLAMKPQVNPGAPPGMLGRLQSVNLNRPIREWHRYQRAPFTTGLLTTDSNLVFVGDLEPSLQARDAVTGKLLWQQPLEQAPSGRVMTYSVDGKQYVAVSSGVTNSHVSFSLEFYNEFSGSSVEVGRAGAALLVFSLPQDQSNK